MKKKLFLNLIYIITGLYLSVCILLYFFQEKVLFFPQKLDPDATFSFSIPFEEITIPAKDNVNLHGILFKSKNPRGLIFYLHGNAGSVDNWGGVASVFTDNNYDVFILDYRGYGKSQGKILSQDQMYSDNQLAYNLLKERYMETEIIILGYSIGSGMASKLAFENHSKQLILQAPYVSIRDMMNKYYPFIPGFILRYRFNNYEYLDKVKVPITIFHGNKDEVIYFESSLKLKEKLKEGDTLIILEGQGHNGMTEHPEYRLRLKEILDK